MKRNKYIIGITGSIATGKSVATNYLQKKGYQVLDADHLAHMVLEQDNVLEKLRSTFGSTIFNGKKLSREKLGRIIFQSESEKEKLSKIVHPKVYQMIQKEIDTSCEEIIFLDIPLLIENLVENKNYGLKFDEIWLIYIPVELQLQRLIKRDQISKDYALSKINSQIDIEDKKKYATVIFDNSRTEKDLEIAISNELCRLKEEIL
ncbi:MAG: dephospho-CoA kinase [Tissierellia bacterium]|nr:dephospho-CoA kinase [Tissierellia bacterium]